MIIFQITTKNKYILKPTSILLIARLQISLFGPLLSIAWRLYFDNVLSNTLKNFMITLDELKKYKSVVKLKTTIFWICIVGVLLHFMVYAAILKTTVINHTEFNLIDSASKFFCQALNHYRF